ncbi:MAG: sensor histidine kinase [Flavobacteriales bacterium]
MKLLTRTSIYYLLLSAVLFAIAAVAFFFFLKQELDEDFTENIYLEKEFVEEFVKDSLRLPQSELRMGITLSFEETATEIVEVLSDTMLMMPWEEELQPYRQLTFTVELHEQWYAATLSSPMVESDDLIEKISLSLAIIALALLAVLFLLTRWLSKRMWRPFFYTLNTLKSFDVNKKDIPVFREESISEFNTLNRELQLLTQRISADYHNLKEFTENASHEMQTPLAIICAKLELLIQSNSLSQEQMKLVQESFETTNRLSKLNQSLLLLSKIENRQFHETTSVNLIAAIENKLEQLAELIAFKNLRVEKKFHERPMLLLNSHLADILLSNLLGNAIKHNLEDGEILIEVSSNALIISNTGRKLEAEPQKMFERFQKNNPSQDAVGLGLAIVKQICDVNDYTITYTASSERHRLQVQF